MCDINIVLLIEPRAFSVALIGTGRGEHSTPGQPCFYFLSRDKFCFTTHSADSDIIMMKGADMRMSMGKNY